MSHLPGPARLSPRSASLILTPCPFRPYCKRWFKSQGGLTYHLLHVDHSGFLIAPDNTSQLGGEDSYFLQPDIC